MAGEEVATCPSCSLVVKVIYDVVSNKKISSLLLPLYLHIALIILIALLLGLKLLSTKNLQEKFKAESEEIHNEEGDKETVKV